MRKLWYTVYIYLSCLRGRYIHVVYTLIGKHTDALKVVINVTVFIAALILPVIVPMLQLAAHCLDRSVSFSLVMDTSLIIDLLMLESLHEERISYYFVDVYNYGI